MLCPSVLIRDLAGIVFGHRTGEIPKSYIKKILPTDPVIVEGGAHIGVDTLEMAKIWPKAKIFAFEPVPSLFMQLEEKTRAVENIHCYPLALAEFSGSTMMYISSGASDGSSSLMLPKEHLTEHPNVTFLEKLQVETTTLDEWAHEQGIHHIDLLWLDIQGQELAVLKASPRVLRSICAIYTEVSLKEMYEGAPLYPEFRRWLEEKGFKVLREALPWPDMGNVLFLNPSSYRGHRNLFRVPGFSILKSPSGRKNANG